jgi:archaellum component FlaC
MSRLTAQKETESLTQDAGRLTDLKDFLSANNNPGNRKRIGEIDEELKRIEKRLEELRSDA